jgi:hypothetical protein
MVRAIEHDGAVTQDRGDADVGHAVNAENLWDGRRLGLCE